MSRFIFFVLSTVMFAGNAAALSPDRDKQQPGNGQAATQNDQPSGSRDSSRTPAKPAATFNPTERIGADSAVSFPVDI